MSLRALLLVPALTLVLAAPAATAAPAPAAPSPTQQAQAKLLGQLVTLTTKKHPGRRDRVPAAIRRQLPKAARRATRLVLDPGFKPKAIKKKKGKTKAKRAVALPKVTIDTNIAGLVEQIAPGVTMTSGTNLKLYDDKSYRQGFRFDLRRADGTGALIRPEIVVQGIDHHVACPTADGLVTASQTMGFGQTTMAVKGARILESSSVGAQVVTTARGHVGADARLHDIDVEMVITSSEAVTHGYSMDTTLTIDRHFPREGASTLVGRPAAHTTIHSAGLDDDGERALEEQYSAAWRQVDGFDTLAATVGGELRKQLIDGEDTWYHVPNDCADVKLDPQSIATVQKGERKDVTGRVVARNGGGEATGSIAVDGVDRGVFVAVDGATRAGAPARFLASGAAPDKDGKTVEARMTATSTAGRAFVSWTAKGQQQLPARFTGDLLGEVAMPGETLFWAGEGTFTLSERFADPDGAISATYKLTAAHVSQAAQDFGDVAGCHHHADASGGYLRGGDLEIRLAADGSGTYALQYDVGIPSTFLPVGCKDPVPPPLNLDVTAVLNTYDASRADGGFRPLEPDWRLRGKDAPNLVAPPGMAKGTWYLDPEF